MTGMDTPASHRHGFTIIELVTVVAILGTLLSIVYIGTTSGADRQREHQAEQAIRNLMLSQLAVASTTGQFTTDPNELDAEPPLRAVTGVAQQPQTISIAVGTDGAAGFAAPTQQGTCVYGRVQSPFNPGSLAIWVDETPCDGRVALPEATQPDTTP